jgi:hypothetical protein
MKDNGPEERICFETAINEFIPFLTLDNDLREIYQIPPRHSKKHTVEHVNKVWRNKVMAFEYPQLTVPTGTKGTAERNNRTLVDREPVLP